ncbi:hypothetical protein [Oceanicaulis sp.]|uniref:hypothetical protein n=1 Tax=Oceanicaulis sp. TaxID=1924941 RepID=UPI003F6FE379
MRVWVACLSLVCVSLSAACQDAGQARDQRLAFAACKGASPNFAPMSTLSRDEQSCRLAWADASAHDGPTADPVIWRMALLDEGDAIPADLIRRSERTTRTRLLRGLMLERPDTQWVALGRYGCLEPGAFIEPLVQAAQPDAASDVCEHLYTHSPPQLRPESLHATLPWDRICPSWNAVLELEADPRPVMYAAFTSDSEAARCMRRLVDEMAYASTEMQLFWQALETRLDPDQPIPTELRTDPALLALADRALTQPLWSQQDFEQIQPHMPGLY